MGKKTLDPFARAWSNRTRIAQVRAQSTAPWKLVRAGCIRAWPRGDIAAYPCDATYHNIKTGDVRTVYTGPGYIDKMPTRVDSITKLLDNRNISATKRLHVRELKKRRPL